MKPSIYGFLKHGSPRREEPDAHGQVALLLTESLIHTLVEKATISNNDAMQIVRSAAEVKLEVATAAGESDKRMKESLVLLEDMLFSFEVDGG